MGIFSPKKHPVTMVFSSSFFCSYFPLYLATREMPHTSTPVTAPNDHRQNNKIWFRAEGVCAREYLIGFSFLPSYLLPRTNWFPNHHPKRQLLDWNKLSSKFEIPKIHLLINFLTYLCEFLELLKIESAYKTLKPCCVAHCIFW